MHYRHRVHDGHRYGPASLLPVLQQTHRVLAIVVTSLSLVAVQGDLVQDLLTTERARRVQTQPSRAVSAHHASATVVVRQARVGSSVHADPACGALGLRTSVDIESFFERQERRTIRRRELRTHILELVPEDRVQIVAVSSKDLAHQRSYRRRTIRHSLQFGEQCEVVQAQEEPARQTGQLGDTP